MITNRKKTFQVTTSQVNLGRIKNKKLFNKTNISPLPGGKHLHIEKFAIRKARSFLRNDKFLCLPGLELLYIWRFIPLMSKESQQKLVKTIGTWGGAGEGML